MKQFSIRKRKTVSVFLAITILFTFCEMFTLDVCADEFQIAAEKIKQGFLAMEESIDISEFKISPSELGTLFSSIIKNEPYLFFVDRNLSYSYKSEGFVLSVKPRYNMSKEEMEKAMSFCREKVRNISKGACGDEIEKALYLHDYICENFAYDESLENDNIYDFLTTGKGTCQAYTLTYIALLRECGISSVSAASDSIVHMWNLVNIKGDWYHVDLTWDDGENISRRHFLLSDKSAGERGHRDWYSLGEIVCSSDEYFNADFDALYYTSVGNGDVDHSGESDIFDLLILRRADESEVNICKKCADIDQNRTVEEADVEMLRQKLLFNYLNTH